MTKILIVDDARFMRVTMKAMLEKNGFKVIGEAENGAVAIEQFSKLQPDIVTLDITMPEMDGITALKEIMKINPKAKVVMVSALGQQNYVMEALKLGAKGFVVKPYKEDYIVDTIKKLTN